MIFFAIFLATFVTAFISVNSSVEKDVETEYKNMKHDLCRPHTWAYKDGRGMECDRCGFKPQF